MTKMQLALDAYHNPSCASAQDFVEDYSRPKKIKKIFSRFRKTEVINHRLVINHIIAMRNVFEFGFFKSHLYDTIGDEHRVILNTYMVFLGMSLDMIDVDKELYAELKREVRAT